MIKLYIFESAKELREFEGELISTPPPDLLKVKPTSTLLGFPVTVSDETIDATAHIASAPRGKYKKRVAKAAPKRAQAVCSKCGKPGHRAPTCGRQVADQEDDVIVDERNEEDLRAAVQGLKEDGLDSIRVAQKLKLTLKKVNQYW